MKNTINGQPETISPHELAEAMQPGRAYSQDEVMGLLPGRPRACVRDTLYLMVDKGMVWRNSSKRGAIAFQLLTGEDLREAVESKAAVMKPPAWMRKDLVGYAAEQNRVRDLCMSVRKS